MERLIKIGDVVPKSSLEVKQSRMGIGFEKLDRGLFDPEKAYDKVAALGVKWIRLQSGWARTEKEKGVYDFAWLDDIVDNLIKRGLKPWICLAYGNGLYTPEAQKVFGAVSCAPLDTAEERQAWSDYVATLAKHFAGRVEMFEVWNEPNWFWTHVALEHQPNGTEYGEFTIATSKAIKAVNKNAKIVGGVESVGDIKFINNAFKAGMGDYIDYFSFHLYPKDEREMINRYSLIRGMCNMYNPDIKIIQGESGAPSRSDGNGESCRCAWTQRRQAKQIARRTMIDFINGVEFGSTFSALDMVEALGGSVSDKSSYLDYGYFGVLAAEFDENGVATGIYTPKMSYKALQTIASVFAEDFETCCVPVMIKKARPDYSDRIFALDTTDNIVSTGFKRDNGAYAFAYWHSSELLTTEFESTVTINLMANDEIKIINLLDGTIYKIPEDMIERDDEAVVLHHIPITDYPLLITVGDF